jgi:hypothetical protein
MMLHCQGLSSPYGRCTYKRWMIDGMIIIDVQ